jgi:hypothetical protein
MNRPIFGVAILLSLLLCSFEHLTKGLYQRANEMSTNGRKISKKTIIYSNNIIVKQLCGTRYKKLKNSVPQRILLCGTHKNTYVIFFKKAI